MWVQRKRRKQIAANNFGVQFFSREKKAKGMNPLLRSACLFYYNLNTGKTMGYKFVVLKVSQLSGRPLL